MKPDYKKLFAGLACEQQKKEFTTTCPRCGKNTFSSEHIALNATSRYENVLVCDLCGTDEAMRSFERKPALPAYQWHYIRNILSGQTFHDFLQSHEDLDCSLIIDGSEMPADFVWDSSSKVTQAGLEYYAEIMQAPCELLKNGVVEIFCDNYELGKDFCLSAAGYTGVGRYSLYFDDNGNTEV